MRSRPTPSICQALPGEMLEVFHPLQARRVGALHRHGHRLGRQGIPRHPAVTIPLAPRSASEQPATRVRTVLVLQHHPDEDPGVLGALLEAAGFDIARRSNSMRARPFPTSTAFDVLLVMGGPQHVWQEDEHPWLVAGEGSHPALGARTRAALPRGLPGPPAPGRRPRRDGQADGSARDRRHRDRTSRPEGLADPVFGELPAIAAGLQWHGAEVVEPPPGALVLAETTTAPSRRCASAPAPGACNSTWRWGRHHAQVGGGPRIRTDAQRTLGSPLLLARGRRGVNSPS